MRSKLAGSFAAAAFALAPFAAQANIFQFNAQLNSANELSLPNPSSATGVATLFYDDHGTLSLADDTYDFAMSAFGLTGGPSGTAASIFHIHGAATVAENAPIRVFLDAAPFIALNSGSTLLVGGNDVAAPVVIPATGATATNAGHPEMSFLSMLQSHLAYVNVHTTLNPGGEIRGQLFQVAQVPELQTYAMLLAGLGLLLVVARRRMH